MGLRCRAHRGRRPAPASISMPILLLDPGSRASRYTARLSLALAARVPVRFFDEGQELLLPRDLIGRRTRTSSSGGAGSGRVGGDRSGRPRRIASACTARRDQGQRIFPYEVNILHDFCPIVVPWAFPDAARDDFVKFLTEDILASDLVLSDLALDESRRGLVLVAGPGADRRCVPRAQPLRGGPSPSRAGRAVGSDRPGGLDDRAAEERRLPVRLVPEDDAAAARHGALVGGEATAG